MLDSRNIKTKRSNKSLDYKNLKLFKIIKVINNIVYELKLLDGIDIYLVFYFWLLYIDNSDPLSKQI